MRKLFVHLQAAALALLLAACQNVVTAPGSSAPHGAVAQPAPGAVHYRVDAGASQVRFLVYKAGPLAAFGHDHTVDARGFSGEVYLAPRFTDSSFSLSLPVQDFLVDDPASRQEEGSDFASVPSTGAIQGTTEHMLGPQGLDAAHYPQVTVQCVTLAGHEDRAVATVRVTLHGTARDLMVPITVSRAGDDLVASGGFDLRQTEFGITPYSAAGGALQVADVLKLKFHIVAHKG